MCCRNRRATAPGYQACSSKSRSQRQPILLTLGQYAYSKYQQRQDSRAALPLPAAEMSGAHMQRRCSPPPDVLELAANGEILERVGVKGPLPPRYEDVVENDALLRSGSSSSSDSSEDAGSLFDARGKETSGGDGVGEEKGLTRHQQKRAEKMARKAEKKARKAERAARKAGRAALGL